MTKKNDITLPTPEDERLLNDVLEDSVDYVEVRGKKYGISWLKRGTIRKFTSTMQKSGNDDKISCQCAAAIILNGYWKIKFFYPFLWRWFFYIKQYGDHELMKVIAVGKKKIPVEDYLTATIDGETYEGEGYNIEPKKVIGGLFMRSEDRQTALFLPNVEGCSNFVSEQDKPCLLYTSTDLINSSCGVPYCSYSGFQ